MGKDKKRKHEEDSEDDDEKRKSSKKIEKVAKLLGYSNDTNPFGDSNLLQPFIWKKKEEKSSKSHSSSGSHEKNEKKRMQLLEEVEKVRKRRTDRENEIAEMDRLRFEEQRLREAASYGDWQQKEEEFHTEQIRIRSVIRILENREQPIDYIAKNLILIDSINDNCHREDDETKQRLSAQDAEINNPVNFIENCEVSELETLLSDCNAYIELEKLVSSSYLKFFESINTVVKSELKMKKSKDRAIHRSILKEVKNLMSGKSSIELDRLQSDIDHNIRDNKLGDREYWESMASEVRIQRAKAYITEVHESNLSKYLDHFSRIHATRPKPVVAVKQQSSESIDESARAKALLRQEEDRGFDEDEGQLLSSDEVILPPKQYEWQDKYRPRKPRYFNRVRTGYDWNKYNMTHYDRDNPPPRMIQGYKFTLFYPELVDMTVTPRYFLEPTEDKDVVVLRFSAGAPYEDVAFRIVNRQWDKHPRSGFKCVFDHGVLHLHFSFMRVWYRR